MITPQQQGDNTEGFLPDCFWPNNGNMIGDCSIFIPTRDSSGHVLAFLKCYRMYGIEPIYVVDTRSVDGTAELLRRHGARVTEFCPFDNYAEAGGIEFASTQSQSTWLLRMDDDEFPSRDLLQAVHDRIATTKNIAFHVPCRELFRSDGQIYENRSKTLTVLNDQYTSVPVRLWRREAVTYLNRVHTAGFITPKYRGLFGPHEYFTHFDRLLRSPKYRIDKMCRYDSVGGPCAYKLSHEYLPELFSLEETRAVLADVTDIQHLLAEIPKPSADTSMIAESVRQLMQSATLVREREAYQKLRFRNLDHQVAQIQLLTATKSWFAKFF